MFVPFWADFEWLGLLFVMLGLVVAYHIMK